MDDGSSEPATLTISEATISAPVRGPADHRATSHRAPARGQRPAREALCRLRLGLFLRVDVGDRGMSDAIRPARFGARATEVEVVVAGVAVRPHAHGAV